MLFAEHDIIGELKDCPFPLKTPTFEVLLFGTSKTFAYSNKKYGNNKTFVVVDWIKVCGHRVQDRVPFIENVETFEHYGTVFEGESYSIKSWEDRLERFRQYPCDVCRLIKHSVWCYRERLSDELRTKKAALTMCLRILDHNFANWRDFVTEASVIRRCRS